MVNGFNIVCISLGSLPSLNPLCVEGAAALFTDRPADRFVEPDRQPLPDISWRSSLLRQLFGVVSVMVRVDLLPRQSSSLWPGFARQWYKFGGGARPAQHLVSDWPWCPLVLWQLHTFVKRTRGSGVCPPCDSMLYYQGVCSEVILISWFILSTNMSGYLQRYCRIHGTSSQNTYSGL